jgi:hypothetical protein
LMQRAWPVAALKEERHATPSHALIAADKDGRA